jgi:hypothetical protein
MYLQKVISRKTFLKTLVFFLASLRLMTKIAGSGCRSGSGSISQRHGSADPDPDPHQNVIDPQHCMKQYVLYHMYYVPVSAAVSSILSGTLSCTPPRQHPENKKYLLYCMYCMYYVPVSAAVSSTLSGTLSCTPPRLLPVNKSKLFMYVYCNVPQN